MGLMHVAYDLNEPGNPVLYCAESAKEMELTLHLFQGATRYHEKRQSPCKCPLFNTSVMIEEVFVDDDDDD